MAKSKNLKSLRIFSFFAGSGFLDLGFEKSGFSVDFVNEFSPAFMNAYKYARKNMNIPEPIHGYANVDVNEFLSTRAKEMKADIVKSRGEGNLVGFIGGPPCPDFSVAGKQKGKDGDNGKLSQSYVDLIKKQKPDFFLFENVKGLWKTAKHREYFEELKKELAKAGYFMTNRLTNALEFGAAQDRDRILLFGIHKSICPGHKNPFPGSFDWTKYATHTMDEIHNIEWPSAEPFEVDSQKNKPENIPLDLTVQHWFEQNDVENHPNGTEHFIPRNGLVRMQTVQEGDDSKKCYKRIHRWRYSPTACYGNNEVHLHPYKERRLTVAEALAIQSLPKEFVLPPQMTLSDKFKTIGNGVPFVLAQGVAKAIYDFLTQDIMDA